MSIAATPLRQVLSKSIHRALREQVAGSPTSPLDLRLSPAIRRNSDPILQGHKFHSKTATQLANKLGHQGTLPNLDQQTNFLEIVYETAKNYGEVRSGSSKSQLDVPGKAPKGNPSIESSVKQTATDQGHADITDDDQDQADLGAAAEDWHTPSEFPDHFQPSSSEYGVRLLENVFLLTDCLTNIELLLGTNSNAAHIQTMATETFLNSLQRKYQ